MDPAPVIETLRDTARALTAGDSRSRLRAIQSAQDALDSAKTECLAELETSRDFELDGASTLHTWVRNELRLGARDSRDLVRAADTLRRLPAVARASAAGQIRTEHVAVFTYGLKHVGAEVMLEFEQCLLDVATTHEPAELRKVVRELREAIFPDELDQAWMDGMDKQDIQVHAVPGGWHVTGFLNATCGAKFNHVLDSISAPRDSDDTRSGSERRVQGLDDLMTDILDNGRPSDKGVRPHLSVMVDAETLRDNADSPTAGRPPAEPATLTGYGHIGPRLLDYLACQSDFTPILNQSGTPSGQAQILNVGRAHRSATLKQRRAIIARQRGQCAAPGCTHTHLEIHHTIWWSRGGPTDLDLLIGLCVRCHHLHHRGMLLIRGNAVDGFVFANQDNRPLKAAYRRRQAAWRENWQIRKAGVNIERRRSERLTA